MALQGNAAIAMWWNVEAAHREEFHEWHSKEHFPERMGVPGFLRGSRWQAGDDSGDMFVLYELEGYETLTAPAYHARLNDPTPWSVKMMPLHRGMMRSQCRIAASRGHGIGRTIATLRISPLPGEEVRLEAAVAGALDLLVARPGIVAAHFLRTETPDAAPTTEQQIRGGDAAADWIVLAIGHGAAPSAGLTEVLDAATLDAGGAGAERGLASFDLIHAVTPQDL